MAIAVANELLKALETRFKGAVAIKPLIEC